MGAEQPDSNKARSAHHPADLRISPHWKMVGIEQRVDRMTILVPKSGAQSYLEESMLVVAAAGMAASVPVWWTPSAHYLILDSQHIKHRMLSAVIENQFKTNGTVPKSAAVVIGNRVFFAPLSPNHICNTFADPFTFICMSFILIPPTPAQHGRCVITV